MAGPPRTTAAAPQKSEPLRATPRARPRSWPRPLPSLRRLSAVVSEPPPCSRARDMCACMIVANTLHPTANTAMWRESAHASTGDSLIAEERLLSSGTRRKQRDTLRLTESSLMSLSGLQTSCGFQRVPGGFSSVDRCSLVCFAIAAKAVAATCWL